jgi:hypothetical protein
VPYFIEQILWFILRSGTVCMYQQQTLMVEGVEICELKGILKESVIAILGTVAEFVWRD